jgi:SAM-dependent methyltransferase
MINLPYLLLRLLRRSLPSFLSYRLLSPDSRAPGRFMRTGLRYLELLKEREVGVAGALVVETGPGTYSPAGLALLKAGARKIILQEPFLRAPDMHRLRGLVKEYWEFLEDKFPAGPSWETLFQGAAYHPSRVQLGRAPAQATGLPENSVDIILSCSVLEHIRDIAAVFKEQHRILKPGGRLLHLVDLRDHFFRYPFEMLTFSRSFWEGVLTRPNRGSGYQNRLRAEDYAGLLQATGFADIRVDIRESDPVNYLRIKPRLHSDFKGRKDEMMAATAIILHAKKRL